MITLENLRKEGNIIKTNYYSDDNVDDQGYLEFDISKDEIVKAEYSEEDLRYSRAYDAGYARRAIRKLVARNSYPKRYQYIWY